MTNKEYLIHLERKAMRLEIKLQNLTKFNRKEDQKEIRKLHYDLNNMWKNISALAHS